MLGLLLVFRWRPVAARVRNPRDKGDVSMKKQQRGGAPKMRRGQAEAAAASSPKQLLAAVRDARAPLPGESDGCATRVERFAHALDRVEAIEVKLTLKEACGLIGSGVTATNFAATAFDVLAAEIDAMAYVTENNDSAEEGWILLQNLAQRARLAAKIERQLSA